MCFFSLLPRTNAQRVLVLSSVAWLCNFFPHIISYTAQFSGKHLLNIKCVFWFPLLVLSETFLIHHHHHHHLSPWIRAFDLFRHRRVAIVSWGVQDLCFLEVCSGEISPTRCNICVFYSQWLYSTCFGWQSHPSSGVQCCIWPQVSWLT